MNRIDPQILFRRAAVQTPYFAFSEIWLDNGRLVASLVAEHQMEDESGPIAAAEAGRHLAILGSCAAAAVADERKLYYLAKKATLKRTDAWPGTGEPLIATAAIQESNKRSLSAKATLYSGGPIFTLDCNYQILTEQLFMKVFRKHRNSAPLYYFDTPYRRPVSLDCITEIPDGLSAVCGPLDGTACAGHFPEFPAWPVAVVMHSLSRLAGRALQHRRGEPRPYSVVRADISADQLAFATDRLSLRTVHLSHSDDIHVFDCLASTQDSTIGNMRLELSLGR